MKLLFVFFQLIALLGIQSIASAMEEPKSKRESTIVVPVIDEPLHVVRHRSEEYLIYTNWIEAKGWTLYHEHRNDLLAIIAKDVVGASQTLGDDSLEQSAPAGTVIFFPYSDSSTPYVHRVGVLGEDPFINIGLEFLKEPSSECHLDDPAWKDVVTEGTFENKHGTTYRLTLTPNKEVVLPSDGSALLLVPLGQAEIKIDNTAWDADVGDFQFYEDDRPETLLSVSETDVAMMLFNGC